MDTESSIFNYIVAQESGYKKEIPINDSWSWSMYTHIKTSDLYNNSQLINNDNRDFKPVKNITRPILNIQHRTEDIEVKDVQIYVNDAANYHLSFLVKKYHDDVFTVENDIDTFFDELNVSRIDFGGGLSKQLNKPCPEVVPLQSIAFCDQTDLLSGPIGIKHYYSPDQLLDMGAKGWGDEKNGATATLEQVIALCRDQKKVGENKQIAKTPGRYVEVYEVHGNLPKKFANPDDDSGLYETRMFIVAMYQKKDSDQRGGVILYTALESESPFKLIKRDPVWGRALGFGGAEELFEPQVWTNYDMIRMQDMLDAASKTILKYTGPGMVNRTKIKDMDNLDVFELGVGEDLSQVDSFPRNLRLFSESIASWEQHAQQMGAATDALFGDNPTAGTPFKLQQQVVQQGLGLHEYRRGQYAKHLEEIYNDWIIPHIEKKICEGATFLSELSLEETQYVMDCVVTNLANKRIVEMVLAGEQPTNDEIDLFKQLVRTEFKKKGNKHFIEILKGEFKDKPLAVKVTVKGKSKDLSGRVDSLVNVFRQIIANPAVLQIPAMSSLFNQIIEASGLDPMDFSHFEVPAGGQQPNNSNPPLPPGPAQPQAVAGATAPYG